ncbi:putative ABC transporter permease YknZ [Pseudoalteromonas sp. P1-9]|uniref:ABC transporter permease n=1 Tax=Pseudoalteromonas sp. P1-9 TaxID=1710354 RepID=UPI0006D608C6|nr:ABC transporter permease [Pseudoalteromonas sp. P1-9]KPV93757.1 putative ABC transporter permease YknZ [Pseudoalteromonas sp. P1-9]
MREHAMVGSYFVSGFRALTRNKMHLFLNIFGLAVGLAAALLVTIFAFHEISFDRNLPKVEQSFRVVERHIPSGNDYSLSSPHAFQHLKKITGVEDFFSLMKADMLIEKRVSVEDRKFEFREVYAVSENILDFVEIEVLKGDLDTVLQQPDKMALSESEAIRFFGTTEAIGMSLVSANATWTVSAIYKDLPLNSHLAMSAIISAKQFERVKGKVSFTYLRIAQNADTSHISSEITKLMTKIWQSDASIFSYRLQPVLDIHLSANLKEEMKIGGSKTAVQISLVLSLLLVIIASFNSINMSIAQSGLRAREVGMRKVLGAGKGQVITQFLFESLAITLIAAFIACLLAEVFLSDFNLLVGRQLDIQYWGVAGAVVLAAVFVVGVLAGLYPAIFISSFNAKRVLSGDLDRGKTAILVRKSLIVLQSALSIGMIIASVSLYQQLNHLQNLPVNYEKSNRLRVDNIDIEKIFWTDSKQLLQDISKIDGVVSVTASDFDFTRNLNAGIFNFHVPGSVDFPQQMWYGGTGFNAVQTLGMELVAGRDFVNSSDWYNSDDQSAAILVPESLISVAGYNSPEEAIGKVWSFTGGGVDNIQGNIVGVFKDVKVGSVKDLNFPIILGCGLSWAIPSSLVIEVEEDNGNVRSDLTQFLQSRLKLFPIELTSVDARYRAIYKEDRRLAMVVVVFSGLAVFLTCMGVFGLSAFTAQRRRKEVAIRKVLGASRLSLLNLIAMEYLLLNLLSMLVSFPVTYYLINDWLNNFNNRIDQSIVLYGVASLTVVFVTWLTTSSVALWAANTKPSLVLRQE